MMFEIRDLFGGTLDREQVLQIFRQTVTEELRDHRLSVSPKDPHAFELTLIGDDEPALSVNTHNVVQEILSNRYGRAQAGLRIAQFAGMIAAALEPKPLDKGALYLALRNHDYAAASDAARLDGIGPGDLRIVVAEDRGAYVSLPSDAVLSKAGLTPDAAYDLAEDNLRSVIPRLTIYEEDEGLTTFVLEGYEWLSSSLLLAPSLLRRYAADVGWDSMLICAPSVEAIHLAESTRKGAVNEMEDLMRLRFGLTRQHSACIFQLQTEGESPLRVAYRMQDDRLAPVN